MKRIFLSILFWVSFLGISKAQYLPEKNNFLIELQLAPFGEQPFSTMGLQGRYFLNEKLALRLSFDFKTNHDEVTTPIYSDITGTIKKGETNFESMSTYFAISPGIEYHFRNNDRLSIYAGGGLLYGMQFANSYTFESEVRSHSNEYYRFYSYQTVDASGAIINPENGQITDYSGTSLGVVLMTGIDFYLYKGLYVGAELGLGYIYSFSGNKIWS